MTLNVPIEALNQVAPEPLGWLVPGMLEEKVLALIRSLPKSLRTRFVPAPDTAKRVVPMLRFGEGDIHAAVAAALSRLGGIAVPPDAFQEDRLPTELRMNVRVTDAEGRLLASGRDLEAIRQRTGAAGGRELFAGRRSPLEPRRPDRLGLRRTAGGNRTAARAAFGEGLSGPAGSRRLGLLAAGRFAAAGGVRDAFWTAAALLSGRPARAEGAGRLAAEPRQDGSSTRRRSRASTCAGSLPSCWPTAPWWPTSPCRGPRTISSGCWPPAASGSPGPCRS